MVIENDGKKRNRKTDIKMRNKDTERKMKESRWQKGMTEEIEVDRTRGRTRNMMKR